LKVKQQYHAAPYKKLTLRALRVMLLCKLLSSPLNGDLFDLWGLALLRGRILQILSRSCNKKTTFFILGRSFRNALCLKGFRKFTKFS